MSRARGFWRNRKLVQDQLAAGAVGDLVLIIPAGVLVALVWAIVEWTKRGGSSR